MKLHLPVLLRKSLYAAFSLLSATTQAGVMHEDVHLQTYTDFGQNKGRYVVGERVNALVDFIRTSKKGIGISYADGTPTFYIPLEQGMIRFSGTGDGGPYAAIAPNSIVTVAHNNSISASYGEREVGVNHAINYKGVDIRHSGFRHTSSDDYMLQRQSKLQVDAVWNPLAYITTQEEKESLMGDYVYHSGGGTMALWTDNQEKGVCEAYVYIIGGMFSTNNMTIPQEDKFVARQDMEYWDSEQAGASEETPLPNAIRNGDSGSPAYRYNATLERYEFLGTYAVNSGVSNNWSLSVPQWTQETLASFGKSVQFGTESTVYLNAVATEGATIEMDGYSTTLWSGTVQNANGEELTRFNGLQTGLNTWADLSDLKDTQLWYAYDADTYHATSNTDGRLLQSIEDLFYTQNLEFTAGNREEKSIVLRDTVDLGVGYAGFTGGTFTIVSESGEKNMFNHAGYYVNEGAEVHLQLVNPDSHMTEWRKMGAGDLYIDGTGETHALLNVGGSGRTYLQQKDGYAAYNVLVNTGATVVIADTGQIKRDLTFGAGGGTLDMNGNGMDWYTTSTDENHFTINALTEEAMITNSTGHATLIYKEAGDSTYLGSFRDTEGGSLTIDYQGSGELRLHGIHTSLNRHDNSGLTVSNGKVVLSGIHTVHGMGSLNGKGPLRAEHENDWHYADATMNVTVKNGAAFELGSHARLTGDVNVEAGGIYIMREGVAHRHEHVEGGVFTEDTDKYRDYFGHKGNVHLTDEAEMRVELSEGVSSTTVYAGNISGNGSLHIRSESPEAIIQLQGNNSFTGSKVVESGGMVIASSTAWGDTSEHTWRIEAGGWIASQTESAHEILSRIHTDSTGTLALSADTMEQVPLDNTHMRLYLGAEAGKTVQYGERGTNEALRAIDGVWKLGGGLGELVVNYKLTGNHQLLLGANRHSLGEVTLTNTENDFSGSINFNSTGIILNAADGALGNATLNLIYGNAFSLTSAEVVGKNIATSSDGMVLVDNIATRNLDMSNHGGLSIAAEGNSSFCGNIILADGLGYLFSALSDGSLTLSGELDDSRSLTVDGHGLTGGTVILAGNDSWSGDITVRGHKENDGTGEIHLALGRDMVSSGTILLEQGGYLDLAGHQLTVQGYLQGEHTHIMDSGSGSLVFDTVNGEMNFEGYLMLNTMRKTGDKTLCLSGANNIRNLYVDSGTMKLGSDTALAADNTIILADKTSLDLGTYTMRNSLRAEEGEVDILCSNSKATLAGNIELGKDTQLNFQENKQFILKGNQYGGSGATIVMTGGTLTLQHKTETQLKGCLAVNGDVTLESAHSASNMNRHLEHVHINGGQLTLREETWNSIWNIDTLSGSGELYWYSRTNHDYTARLIIGGDGGFEGTVSMNRTFSNAERTHQAFLELASDTAAKNANIDLQGAKSNAVATLAINTENAHTRGLSGNEHSFVYAGAAKTDSAINGSARPETTRTATLTLDTAAGSEHIFSGTLGNSTDSAESGISIVKKGSGKQVFNGASAVMNNISALAGTLEISTPSLTVNGDVVLARGADLYLRDTLSLNAGQQLSLVPGEVETTSSAELKSALVLNGGNITVDARGLSATSPLLSLTSTVTAGDNFGTYCRLDFTHISTLAFGSSYQVSNGDWSAFDSRLTYTCAEYADATLTASTSGLSVVFSAKDDYVLWLGDENVLQQDKHLVFNGCQGHTSAKLTAAAEVGVALFDNEQAFTVTSENGSSFSASELRIINTGELILNTDVSTDNMQVEDAALISGNGSLSVDTLKLKSDLSTRMSVQVNEILSEGGSWILDGSANAFTQSLTTAQVNSLPEIQVEGQATLELQVLDGESATITNVNGSGHLAFTGGGSLEKNQQEHINISRAELSGLTLKNGSTSISGEVNIADHLAIALEEVTLTEGAQVTASQVKLGDTAESQPSTVSIEEGASLTITGNTDTDSNSASFLLAHWKSSASTLTLNGGNLTAENTRILMGWDSGGRFEALSGEAHLKGILFSSKRDFADTLVLNGARLNIGSGGIAGININDSVQLGKGTIASTADFSISGNNAINIVDTSTGTTFDTANHTISVNTALQGEGRLIKVGSGTLKLAATNTHTGSIEVQEGTLELAASQTARSYDMATGTKLSVTHSDGATEISGINGNAGLSKNAAGKLLLNSAQLADATLKGGSTTISGVVNIVSKLSIAQEDVTFAKGARVTTNQYSSGDTANYQPSTVSIDEGASLTITGNTDTDSNSASFLLAHWKSSASTLTLNGGNLTAENTRILMGWDSGGRFEALSGEAHLKGILFSSKRDFADTLVLNGARLNIGSGGITGISTSDTVRLVDGTIAATADFSISGGTVQLEGTSSGTVFDTNGHNITINSTLSGVGKLVKEGNGSLLLGSNALSVLNGDSSVVVNNGVLDLSAAAADSSLLNRVSGAGTIVLHYDMPNDNGTGFDFSGLSGVVQLDQGRIRLDASTFGDSCPDFHLTSGNSQLVFAGSGTRISGDVVLKADTIIHSNNGCSGEISGEVNGNYTFTKKGAGSLDLSGGLNIGTLKTAAGSIILSGRENSIGMLDASMGKSATGAFRLGENAHLTVTGEIWGRNHDNTALVLSKGASLTNTEDHIVFSNRNNEGNASMACTSADAEYNIQESSYVFSNGHLQYTGGDATLNNRLAQASVENSGNGLLTVDNSQNTINGLHATGGSINVLNMAGLDLNELELAISLSLGVYTGSSVEAEQEADIRVNKLASFGSGVTLNANLTLKSGATLLIESAVQMGSDVRLETGLTLSGTGYDSVQQLKAGEKVALFTGIDTLYLNSYTESTNAFSLNKGVRASDYFTNLSDSYFLEYDTSKGAGEGILSIAKAVPEPSTVTLSLLALAALAVRRRR